MGCWGKHRDQASIAKDHIPGIVDDKTGLEVQVREVGIYLVNIARQVNAIALGDFTQALVLGSFHGQAGFVAPGGNAFPHGETCQHIFWQDHQPDRAAAKGGYERLAAPDHGVDPGQARHHGLRHRAPLGQAIDCGAIHLQGQSGVGALQHGHSNVSCCTPSTRVTRNVPVPARRGLMAWYSSLCQNARACSRDGQR